MAMSVSTPMLRLTPAAPFFSPPFDNNDFQSNAINCSSALPLQGLGLLYPRSHSGSFSNNGIRTGPPHLVNVVGLSEFQGLGPGGNVIDGVRGSQGTGPNTTLSNHSKVEIHSNLEIDATPSDFDSQNPPPTSHELCPSHKPQPTPLRVNDNHLDDLTWLCSPPTLDDSWRLQYPYELTASFTRENSTNVSSTELALGQSALVTSDRFLWSGPEGFFKEDQLLNSRAHLDHELFETRDSPGFVGPIADINMYHLDPSRNCWSATVNPMNLTGDVMGGVYGSLLTLPSFPMVNSSPAPNSFLGTPHPKFEISGTFTPLSTCRPILEAGQAILHSRDEKAKPSTTNDQAPLMLDPAVPKPESPRQEKRERGLSLRTAPIPEVKSGACHSPDIDLGTPVIDAHRGITINDLKAKAERYILRNQDREYNKHWLALFAGRLTPRGEKSNDFRCYVDGCDHILIHMGAHLDFRLFKCAKCTSRFLRKNECKRHEASHLATRPFPCAACAKAFARHDLLQRHMRNIHHIAGPNKENAHGATKRCPSKRPKWI
ncbi:hypothetical protein BD779DRAFT_1489974 [Infundibulicybe gibba]|nr:hypothetical protein BD779DRAFT_1489974 [Infundibulicybe gibba]